ncbi:hypothetical protein LTR17_015784 [Elasticomyces elasticus]|nr:hypothetical protein LTR17_015784 [Elasticomyces elasticus]
MASSTDDNVLLISRLIAERNQSVDEKNLLVDQNNLLVAEKDRLVLEKDELGVSKDRLWREMYQLVRERDNEIARLKELMAPRREAYAQDATDDSQILREEARGFKRRIKELERTLHDALEQGEDADEYAYLETGDGTQDAEPEGMRPIHGNSLIIRRKLEANSPPADLFRTSFAAASSPTMSDRTTIIPTTVNSVTAKFTFAPLIAVVEDGTEEFGRISDVSATVLQSIETQLQTLRQRNREGKSPLFPTLQFKRNLCMWAWMHGSHQNVRWTVDAPRTYTCANCFNGRRVCLYWRGNTKWMILPLPPAARDVRATWQDPGYYVSQADLTENSNHSPGVWQASSKSRNKAMLGNRASGQTSRGPSV